MRGHAGRPALVAVGAALLLVAALLVPASASAAAPNWTAHTLPATRPVQSHASLSAVSCPTATFCLAVGAHVGLDGNFAPLAETWNGRAWRVTTTSITGVRIEDLSAVSCRSRSFCVAVANSWSGSAHVVRWTGRSWAVQSLGTAHPSILTDVQCAARTSCLAVGSIGGRSAAWHFNGTTWRQLSVTYPRQHTLDALSCPSASVCYLAGTAHRASHPRPYVARWNGHTLTRVSLPATVGTFADISCPSTSRCTAVGAGGAQENRVLVGDLRGGTLRYSTIRSSAYYPNGTSVACTATGTCTALVSQEGEQVLHSVAVRHGSGAFVQSRAVYNDLSGLSCAGTTCTVVGSSLVFDRGGNSIADVPASARAFRRHGTALTRVHVPQPPAGVTNDLTGVSCASDVCATVGTVDFGSSAVWLRPGRAAAWRMGSSSSTATFAGVSCSSATFCMAVGAGTSRSYDGRRWVSHPVPMPNPKRGYDFADELTSVSCVSATWCDAAGTTANVGNPDKVFVVHWNGSSWKQVSAPSPGRNSMSVLTGISCTSSTACLAVGISDSSSAPLVERWNGTAWTIVATTGLPAHTQLGDVSCWAATGCLVGTGPDDDPATTATWNGTRFTVRPLVRGTTVAALSCVSATSCTAAGDVVQHWDGTAWRVTYTPHVSGEGASFAGISCVSGTARCTAVGSAQRAYVIGLVADGTAG